MSEQNKKTAQAVPPPPKYRQNKVTQPAQTPGKVPQRGELSFDTTTKAKPKAYTISPDVAAVKEMQKAILDFANTAAANDVTDLQGNQKGQMYGEQSRLGPQDMPASRDLSAPEDNQKEYLGGSDPFGNFLTQQYIGKSDAGRQYLNVDVAGNKNRQDHSMQDLNFRGVIDSIKRIGTPGSVGTEKSVDGIWQVRTNNALKNIYAIADGLVHFAKDMTLAIPGYGEKELASFAALIPKEYTDVKPEERAQRAKDLTSHIKAVTGYFESFKNAVLNNKRLRAFIDQRKSFVQIPQTKASKPALDEKESKTLSTFQMQAIPGVQLPFIKEPKQNWISLKELSDLDSFKGFMSRVGRNPNNQAELKSTLDEVNKALQSAKF